MNIGRVIQDSYIDKETKKTVSILVLDIRTASIRKKFNIHINKNKYQDGILKPENIISGKEEHPDYHIWANFSGRNGDTVPSQIIGNIKNMISESGTVHYKRCKIFDPFISRYNIYFTLFAVDEDRRQNENHLYNAVAEAYVKQNTDNNHENSQTAQPTYDSGSQQSAQTYQKPSGENIPMQTENIEVDEDEIPF